MTNLVSLGRTESEVMQIMSVAMDMSAGMGISLDTAITQLNATLNGNIGRLGQQNAELKGLTEEELKQGRAIEILGEKFKGLSGATADTSKQLQNIKGDFKEALGQFTLPSSDLWNKFWAGFYEKGIEVINKINAYIDAQTIGRKLASEYVKQIKAISTEKVYNPETGIYDVRDLGARVKYIREALKVLSNEELEALNNYLSSQRRLNDEEQQLLNRIKAEQDSRYQGSINAKKEAEEKKKQAVAEEKITAELQKQEEIASKKTDWASKLLDQRIEMLETERDRAMQLAEEEGKESYSIWIDYNQKILELKLERLEKEKKKALAEEGLTAEDKIAIEEYYSNETKKIYNELSNYKKKKGKEEAKDEKSKFAVMVEYAKQYAQKIKQIFSKVVSTIKNVFSSATNIFKKLFDFDIDDALDVVLQVEDNILTFFVETLPRLPRFVQSVMQSIRTLLRNLKNIIKRENISEAVSQMLKAVGDNLPELVTDLLDVLEKVVGGAVDGLFNWLGEGGGFVTILNMVLKIQQTIEKIVTDNIGMLADFLAEHVEDLADFLANSMMSANKTLPKLIQAVLKIVTALIEAIAKAFENEEFVKSIVDSIMEVTDAIIKALPKLIGAIVKLIANIISALIPYLPELILQLVTEIVQALPSIIGAIASALSDGIKKIFSKIFTADFWSDVLSSMVGVLGQIIKSAFSGIGSAFTGGSSGSGNDLLDFLNPISSPLSPWNWFASGTNNAPAGLSVVGEAGPELVKFRGGEQVLNNRNTNKALANMSGTTINQNVTFNNLQDTTAFGMMQQLRAYNRQMAINGIM
jgi:AcrR family transcriptional regulator